MPSAEFSREHVAKDVLLDGRLALFHEREHWLAISDLHFGYELSQRAAGRLVPLWGMASLEERIFHLLEDYRPQRLIILGDLVHDKSAAFEARELLERIQKVCEPIVIAGNHDRRLGAAFQLLESWQSDAFHFHHGHCKAETPNRIQIIGHHHPARTISDGAGLRLKCPAFVQQSNFWIMPAFSPWSSGGAWPQDDAERVWLCTPHRIFQLPHEEAVSA